MSSKGEGNKSEGKDKYTVFTNFIDNKKVKITQSHWDNSQQSRTATKDQ